MDRYGWRYQIRPWVQAGYRVIAPDMLGYGQTDKPLAIADYTLKKLADDLAALLDIVNISKVVRVAHTALPPPTRDETQQFCNHQVAIGHDWGSGIVGRFTDRKSVV